MSGSGEAGAGAPHAGGRIAALRAHMQSPLFKNAYALIVNTGLTSIFGAAYWIVAARAYDADDVGHASAVVSAMMLLSAITQLNLLSVLIRFLPRAGGASRRLIAGSYLIAGVCAVVVTTVVLVVAYVVAADDNVLHMSFLGGAGFIASTVIWSVFSLQDAVLTGLRKSVWVAVENALYGLAKIIALFVVLPLVSWDLLGASDGIFASWTIPTLVALVPVNWLIFRKLVPDHVRRTRADEQPLQRKLIARFIAGDYTAGLFAQASTTLLPVMVSTVLGKTQTAYFFIPQIIATALDKVSLSFQSSLTVEAANDEHRLAEYASAVLRRGLLVVTVFAGFVVLTAPWLLRVFGAQYTEHSTAVLRLLAIASVPRVFSMVYGGIARLQHKTYRIAIITFAQAVVLVGGSLVLMPHLGVTGVGWAAVASQAIIVLFVAPRLLRVTHPGH